MNKWTPTTVKERLKDILNDKDLEISEQECREIQHFFNERSACFLRKAKQALMRIEYMKRHPRVK